MWGATCQRGRAPGLGRNFNPRAPCGVRPIQTDRREQQREISIHAPRAGCDLGRYAPFFRRRISIHAPRAGCDPEGRHDAQPQRISIHAPRAGCDPRSRPVFRAIPHFNPRTPCGVRPGRPPRRPTPEDFNPRTPCGVRPAIASCIPRNTSFQSTHPVRGATRGALRGVGGDDLFQSTHPVRGATSGRGGVDLRSVDFNPRTPCGVRLPGFLLVDDTGLISIHAPRAGCDGDGRRAAVLQAGFQSTHPVRGATLAASELPPSSVVFQSTHPVRGATKVTDTIRRTIRFQSTHPVRGATNSEVLQGILQGISIHAPRAGCDAMVPVRSAPDIQ